MYAILPTHTAAFVEKMWFFKKYEYKQKGERKGGQSVSKKLSTAMQATKTRACSKHKDMRLYYQSKMREQTLQWKPEETWFFALTRITTDGSQ